MPLYEYKCHSCSKTFEVLQKFSDEPVKIHEECGGEVERLISRSAFQLKGSGWYATDYAKSNGGGTKDDSKPAGEKSADSKESGASESKPAETKSSETKPSETKPAPAPAANPSA